MHRPDWSLAAVAVLLLAGCAAPGGPVENPIGRTLTWFSYVNGDDIRQRCTTLRDRYRLVYNAIYTEQVRTYDITQESGGEGATLQARALNPATLASFNLLDPFGSYRGQSHSYRLDPTQFRQLEEALTASGFNQPVQEGMFLRSDNFYWVASGCRDGVFQFQAWSAPETDLASLPFVETIRAFDHTGVPFNEPRKLYLGPFQSTGADAEQAVKFQLQTGRNGLVLGPRH